nr:hypothetical protein [Tanacetum cinerariifolium]
HPPDNHGAAPASGWQPPTTARRPCSNADRHTRCCRRHPQSPTGNPEAGNPAHTAQVPTDKAGSGPPPAYARPCDRHTAGNASPAPCHGSTHATARIRNP